MKKILNSKAIYIVLIIITLAFIILNRIIIKKTSFYKIDNNIITGKIINIQKYDDKISFIIKAEEKVKCTIYNYDKDLLIGDEVVIQGAIKTPYNNTINNTFNYKQYLYNHKIYKTITVNEIKVLSHSHSIFVIIKNKINKRVDKNPYLKLFIIGNKSSLNEDYEIYKNIGIAHLLAISGMHVNVLILILKKIFFFLKKSHTSIVISLFLFFYCYIVSFSPSIIKVSLLFVIGNIFKSLNINDNFKKLIICITIMLLLNPLIIYDIGFIYSLLCSFFLILIKKYMVKNYLKNIIIISFFLTLATLPVTINLNYKINLMLFLSNIILIPYVSFILFPFSIITLILPFLNPIFNVLISLLKNVSTILNKVNFLVINIPKMGIIFIIIYYILLILFIYYNKKKYILLLLILFIILKINYLSFNNYLYFFDVSQGDSLLMVTKKRKTIMIDTGGLHNYQVIDNIVNYLKSVDLLKINYLIITHGDFDHMGEAINLVNNIKVENVIFNCGPYNDLEKELIKVLDNKKIKYYSCIKELNIDDNKLYFLQTKEYDNENDNSNVIYTELDGYKFMFMGDAGKTREKDILEKYNLSNIDVLKVGHHGSKTSSSKSFIKGINPKYSIISVGKNNRYGHPNKEVLENLEDSKIYRTDQDGSVMFKIKKNKLKIETCSP